MKLWLLIIMGVDLWFAAAMNIQNNVPVPTQAAASRLAQAKTTSSYVSKSERRENQRDTTPRQLCDRCSRPPSICFCQELPPNGPIITATEVLILQHPSEFRRKTISTTPLLPLVLSRCSIRVGYSFDNLQDLPPVTAALSRGQRPLLLFPGEDAVSLDDGITPNLLDQTTTFRDVSDTDSSSATNPSSSSSYCSNLLIILDGTWSQAKKMARESPSLLACCQKVQFTNRGDSIYGAIRTQPEEHCLSTLECCAQALLHLEPDSDKAHTAVSHLNSVLRTLVDQQQQMRISPPPRDDSENNSQSLGQDLLLDGRDIVRLPDGSTLRKLRHSDVPLVNSQWDRGDARTSLQVLSQRIAHGDACFGIFRGHELCGFILQYEDGVLGMLEVAEAYRRRGYASTLLAKATHTLEAMHVPCVAYILDGNAASEAVFTQQGWVKENPTAKRGTGRRRAKRKWIR